MKNNRYQVFILNVMIFCPVFGNTFNFVSNKTQNHLDPEFIKRVVEVFKPDIFFETGTCIGETALAAAPFFKEIHTVELSQELYKISVNKLISFPHIHIHCNSSPTMIKKVVPTLKGHILFWLDAHYSGGSTVHGSDDINDPDGETAIRKELEAIKEYNVQNCTILIDDIRMFGSIINDTEYFGCWAYPSIQEVCKRGKEINPNFSFALLGDMLLMYDATQFNPSFSSITQACTASRLYDGTNLNDEQLYEHEKVIIQAQGHEREFIKNLYNWTINYRYPLLIYNKWYDLINRKSI